MTTATGKKKALLSGPGRLYSTIEVQTASGPFTLEVRRPPQRVLEQQLLPRIRAAKDAESAGDQAAAGEGALPAMRGLVAACLYDPDNPAAPLFTEDELLDATWLPDVQPECLKAVGMDVKAAGGNSSETRSSG